MNIWVSEKRKILKVDAESEKSILRNLFQAYEAEFSKITKKVPLENGMFPLDIDLDEDYDCYLFYLDVDPVGFAVKGV